MKTLVLIALVSVVPLAAGAAQWTVDPAQSHIAFSGTQTGQTFSGTFKSFTATISFDPANPAGGHASVVIDIAGAATGDAQRDTAIPQAEWFDVGRFPRAKFETAAFTHKSGDDYEARGKLTIRDVTADVTLPFKLTVAGGTAHAVGHADLSRATFGVGQGPWASGDMIGLQVGVDIDLVARETAP